MTAYDDPQSPAMGRRSPFGRSAQASVRPQKLRMPKFVDHSNSRIDFASACEAGEPVETTMLALRGKRPVPEIGRRQTSEHLQVEDFEPVAIIGQSQWP
jgi:hypothetical protein